MTAEGIKTEVVQLVSELFSNKGYDTDIIEYVDLIDDLGMDSITFISIVVEIEAKFSIIVPDNMLLMENFRKIEDIVNVIEQERTKQLIETENRYVET
jgi:acyl carrier protein